MTFFSLSLCSRMYQTKAKNIVGLFGKTLLAALLVNMFLAGGVAVAAVQHPNILINADELNAIKAKVAVGAQPWKSAYDKMISQANSALNLSNMSVTFGGKNQCGNVNVYCTDPFYNGSDRVDFDTGARLIGAGVRDLGMAYAFSGEARYADKLIELIRVWALDATTAMQPTFANHQARIDLYPTMTGLIYGADLAWNYPGWSQSDKDAFKAWVDAFGQNAMQLSQDPNNFENWKVAFISIAGAFTGDQTLLNFAFQRFRDVIPSQIGSRGTMEEEKGRTSGWGGIGYSMFALHAMSLAAEVARHHGVDLYNYTSDGNKGLKLALDYHAPYLLNLSAWPFGKGTQPLNASHGIGIYELAYSVWQDPAYLNVVNRWGRPMGMNIWALGVVTLTHANRFDLSVGATAPSIVAQPAAVTVTEGDDASFSVVSTGSGSLAYQWFRDGNSIAGATGASHTVPGVSSSDNGSVYSCEVSNSLGSINSSGAMLTVLSDSVAPTLVSVLTVSDTRVDITFSEPVSASSAENIANYQIDLGVAVTSASLGADDSTVSLTVSQLAVDTTYTVLVSNVQDIAQNPNTITAQSSLNFTYRTADGFEDGNADGWNSLVDSNWSVVMDEGDMAYYLNTTNFGSPGGGRLGEYSLLPADYADFTFTAQAKLGDDVASSALADYAVIFGFQDSDNYYYMLFNNDQDSTQLFKVIGGNRTPLATADSDWLSDNAYHSIEISRAGSAISVRFDGNVLLSANDNSLGAGKVGVGSFNDSAYFDDVSVTDVVASGGGSTGGGSTGGGSTGGGSTGGGSTGGGSTGGGSTGGGSTGGGSTGGGSTGGGSTGSGPTGGGPSGSGSVSDSEPDAGGGALNPFTGFVLMVGVILVWRRRAVSVLSAQV
ncbi:MAG TPA: hypothetical protein ENK04_00690 [Gammaproteobacteria bacterium]|nr:hypothetical protein [Gammaproteobacteria bacterium]